MEDDNREAGVAGKTASLQDSLLPPVADVPATKVGRTSKAAARARKKAVKAAGHTRQDSPLPPVADEPATEAGSTSKAAARARKKAVKAADHTRQDSPLPPVADEPATEAGSTSKAAATARQKAVKAADHTSAAARTVSRTRAAAGKARTETETGSQRSGLLRAVALADAEAHKAEEAARAAVEIAKRAAKHATRSEEAAVVAREREAQAIKARAKLTAVEIEAAQAERAGKVPAAVRRQLEAKIDRLSTAAKAATAVAEAAAEAVAALASKTQAEAVAAASKVEDAARAVKRTETAAQRAEKAAKGAKDSTKRNVAETTAVAGVALSKAEIAVHGSQISAKAAKRMESAAALAVAAAASKVQAEKAAVQAAEAAARAARAEAETGKDLRAPELYLNRELTWLGFCSRVLHEAADERTPLLERVKFLAIVSSNLDEFFMKRIGGLKQLVGAGIQERTVDGRTPDMQIRDSINVVREIQQESRRIFLDLVEQLHEQGIAISSYSGLLAEEQAGLRDYYLENIFPLVTPLAMDPAHPFPHISNLSLNLLVTLRSQGESNPLMARVKVPIGRNLPRFLRVGSTNHFVPLEEVMASNLDVLFPDTEIETCELFRVTRNANTERDEDQADDLLEMIESEVRDRRFAPIVRIETRAGILPLHRGMLAAELGLDEDEDVFESDVMLGMADLMEIASVDGVELHDSPHHPIDNVELQDDRSIFHLIRGNGPILLEHPYESFTTSVVRFVREACMDPKVLAIKMTLYRTTEGTGIIDHLVEAARNGKQVAVAVELKARFDEAANIKWANKLEDVGIHVTYGVLGLKTHSKLVMVIRQDYDGLRRYAHIGTGNYHAGTARIYSDFGLLTCDNEIGADLVNFFNFLTSGCQPVRRFSNILVSPRNMKDQLLAKIDREIALNSRRSPGLIRLKTNALEDPDITEALYQASRAGVKVELIVRDSCRIRPGIKGLSDRISVVSVVGRFLEHSRVYYFRNGGAEEFYIGSADLMRRNLESRAEVAVRVDDEALRDRLRNFLDLQLADRRSVWDMQSDGTYVQRRPRGKDDDRDCQHLMIAAAEARDKEARRLQLHRPKAIARRGSR